MSKDGKKGFYKYISGKRNTRENVGPLWNEAGDLVTWDMEKVEILNATFLVFAAKTSLQVSQASKTGERLEQGKCTHGGRASGQGILKQTGHR